jgi:predicted polyphosphate/ATP-dependent NAD kinase
MGRIGFVINPVAGMGGRVGLKGTDGVADEAVRRGAQPTANARAREALSALAREPRAAAVEWLTAAGAMGEDALRAVGFAALRIVHRPSATPSAQDTRQAVAAFLAAGVDMVLFCGGDGTARDVCSVTGEGTPILGIPAGVKMYSGVFGVTPGRTADILVRYLAGEVGLAGAEILDLDEDKYREGEWAVRLYLAARTPFEPSYLQAAKAIVSTGDDEAIRDDIAAHLREQVGPDALLLLGPGSTLQGVAAALQLDKTLLGIDAAARGRIVGRDLAERQILDLLGRFAERRLVLSPIGAQGFVLGRGNQPLSPAVIRLIGLDNLIVVATPAKLARTPCLRFDSGDPSLDQEMISRKFFPVVVGYHRLRFVKVAG